MQQQYHNYPTWAFHFLRHPQKQIQASSPSFLVTSFSVQVQLHVSQQVSTITQRHDPPLK